jgi:glucosamine-6-phosphate deaminase
VAFNEPGSRAEDQARVVALDATTRASLGSSFADGGVPERGLTLGLCEIAAAEHVVLLVTGPSKATVLADIAASRPDPALPASLLAGHRGCRVLADGPACMRLPAL